MAYVVVVNYAVLINSVPTPFFKASRGLRQGCSLSPLLFILVMESLSLHIKKVIQKERYKPLPICRDIFMSHNLFVDDILLSAILCKSTWICLYEILGRFQKATGMYIDDLKSSFHVTDVNGNIMTFLTDIFNIKAFHILKGFKYLGFNFRPVGYRLADWSWILDQFYKKISTWEYMCLSIRGRAILTQSLLVQIMVYWAHLFYIPSSTINSLNRIIANFIWGGQKEKIKYHLSKILKLTRPKKMGGAGEKIHVSSQLLKNLHSRGYFFWANAIKKWDGAIPIWKTATEMQLPGALESQWNAITISLQSRGLYRLSARDCLIWKGLNGASAVYAKHIYLQILLSESDTCDNIFPPAFWKSGCPLKIIIFGWLVFHDRNLTWENLQKCKWCGPAICPLRRSNSENNLHIFLQCPQSQLI
eukprot:PITA_27689